MNIKKTKNMKRTKSILPFKPVQDYPGEFHVSIKNKFKQLLFLLFFLCSAGYLQAQELTPIKLNDPDKSRGLTVMAALSNRASVREWSSEKLSLQDLSDLVWAANGINRPAEGKRTAPSARNAQDIDVYVFAEEGIYLYDAAGQILNPVNKGDYRNILGKQEAPVVLLLVSVISRFPGEDNEQKVITGAFDAGIVSQNIALFCAGTGLKTRPRAGMDKEKIKEVLSLNDDQLPMLNLPVGYQKK
jgi:nitroreductase